MRYLMRPSRREDEKKFYDLVLLTSWGITSLPKNKTLLKEKLELSCLSFEKEVRHPENELYLFFLEEAESKEIVGVSGIKARSGWKYPLHLLEIKEESLVPYPLSDGPSELCSLYLNSAHRSAGLGKLLSYSRFLFIASHRERFSSETLAQLRGVIEEDGTSPFWKAVGEKRHEITFDQLTSLIQSDPEIVETLMPHQAIKIKSLPKEARDVIKKPNKNTIPALKMLEEQGLKITDYIDPFDAGPILKGKTGSIKAVQESGTASVEAILHESLPGARLYIASNNALDFRACIAEIELGKGASIDKKTAQALGLSLGEKIRYLELSP